MTKTLKYCLIFIISAIVLILFGKLVPRTISKDVVFWTLQMGDFASYINEVISEFEANNNVKIKWIDIPFSEGEKRTLAAILSDTPPDLINLNPDFSALLAQKGTLYEIPQDKLSQFNSQIIESLKYNKKLYSIPWYATSAITIYNKELIDKAGISSIPKNYTELIANAKKMKDTTGKYIFMPTLTENDTTIKILNKYGFNSENIVSAEPFFADIKALYDDNLIPKESITQTLSEALEQFMAGNIATFQGGANFLNMIKENSPEIYQITDVAPQIVGSIGQNDFSLMNFIIPLKSKKKKEALEFALFLTNKENQLKLAHLTNVLATNSEALKSEFYNDYTNIESKARSISAKQLDNIMPTLKQSNNKKELNIQINTTVQLILLNKMSIKNALADLKNKWLLLEK